MDHYRAVFRDARSAGQVFDGDTFLECRFEGDLPDLNNCLIDRCDLSGTTVYRLTGCEVVLSDFSNADFRNSNTSYTETRACVARHALFTGMQAVLDCRFFAGLELAAADAWALSVLGMVPESSARTTIYAAFPDAYRRKARAILQRPYREETP